MSFVLLCLKLILKKFETFEGTTKYLNYNFDCAPDELVGPFVQRSKFRPFLGSIFLFFGVLSLPKLDFVVVLIPYSVRPLCRELQYSASES